jgi:hypothetical protein
MLTFTRKLEREDESGHGNGGRFLISCETGKVCFQGHWALGGCGLDSLYRLVGYSQVFDNAENFNAFLNFIKKKIDGQCYNPREFIFALSSAQVISGQFKYLIEKSKQLDQFPNRSHGPSDIIIYRLSV